VQDNQTHLRAGEIRGRVSSLLEVGTGFHPELTGKENIYLNGTILGMKKWEIDEKYENIVSFSGVGKFIETPVKRYSSGMKVRLAFSVAAHLEPEILIVDEVLAVGDAEFQRKCLNKMEEVGEGGRTVLFVSHNLQALARLCPRAILLEGGMIVDDGPSNKIIGAYLNSGLGTSAAREWVDPENAPRGDVARLRAVRVVSEDESIAEYVEIDRPFRVEMEYDVVQPDHVLLPNFHFYNDHGVEAFAVVDVDPTWRGKGRPEGRYISSVEIPGNIMAEGLYTVRAALVTLSPNKVQFNESSVVAFTMVDNQNGNTARGDYVGHISGAMRPLLNWNTKYSPARRSKDDSFLDEERQRSAGV
jgi:lipopolysaccharide transport system ATP-binding protein